MTSSGALIGYAESPIDDRLGRASIPSSILSSAGWTRCGELNVLLGEAFAGAAALALRQAGAQADLVASHGQTVWHQVAPGHTRSTLQLGEPSVIAERLGVDDRGRFSPT